MRVIAAVLVGVMQILTGAPEIIVLTWVLLAVMGLAEAFRRGAALGRILLRFSFVALLISGLAAAQLLPFLDLLAHSHRDSGFSTSAWSMPATGWVNFLVPLFRCHPGSHGVFVQNDQYLDAVVLPRRCYCGAGALRSLAKPRAACLDVGGLERPVPCARAR